MTDSEKRNALQEEEFYIKNLLKLKAERPELRIVPMVDGEIVADSDNGYWMGSWGDSKIVKVHDGSERWYTYDDRDMEETLIDAYGYDWYDKAAEEELKPAYDRLKWEEVIVVYIELPIE